MKHHIPNIIGVASGSIANAVSSSHSAIAVTSSYALEIETASETITSLSNSSIAFSLVVANGRLYGLKGSEAGYDAWAATTPNSNNAGLLRGINNMYEIHLPDEDSPVIQADTYGYSNYALCENGNLYTWGDNGEGQLALGDTTDRYYPELASTEVVEVYRHIGTHIAEPTYTRIIVRKTDGKVYAAGYNGQYELGLGDTTDRTSLTELPWIGTNPLSVWNLGNYRGNIIAQKSDTKIWGSGYNGFGELGTGNTSTVTSAVDITNPWTGNTFYTFDRIEDIAFGGRFYDGVDQDRFNIVMLLINITNDQSKIRGAGENQWGSLGDGTTTDRSTPVSPTGDFTNVIQISGRGGAPMTVHALKSDGTLWGWGYNSASNVGNGASSVVTTPVQVATGVTNITSRNTQGAAYYSYQSTGPVIEKADGYYSVGLAYRGERGDGDVTTTTTTFSKIKLPKRVRIQYFTEQTHSNQVQTRIAIDQEGILWAWGSNGEQAIDESDTTNIYQPIGFKPPILKK